MNRICVMGVGNVLMADDGFGPHVLKLLESQYELSAEVVLWDAGTPGLDLTLFLDGYDALIAIDSLKATGQPGDVRSYTRSQLLDTPLPIVLSPHEPTLREALIRLEMYGRCPASVLLVGAIPERIETGPGLTATMQRAIPAVLEHVVRELQRLGATVARRAVPATPDLWWERPVHRSDPCASASLEKSSP